MIITAITYQVINLVLHAGHRVLAQLARLPQFGHLILLTPKPVYWKSKAKCHWWRRRYSTISRRCRLSEASDCNESRNLTNLFPTPRLGINTISRNQRRHPVFLELPTAANGPTA